MSPSTPTGFFVITGSAARFRHARTVFAAPPWREISRTDGERTQTWDEACRVFEVATDA